MIVIASIHQPSTHTLLLFDNVLLLSEGKTVYYGPPGDSIPYFESQGCPLSSMMSPAEFMLELTNGDFANNDQDGRLEALDYSGAVDGSPLRHARAIVYLSRDRACAAKPDFSGWLRGPRAGRGRLLANGQRWNESNRREAQADELHGLGAIVMTISLRVSGVEGLGNPADRAGIDGAAGNRHIQFV